jgi:Fe2+ transport system protein B
LYYYLKSIEEIVCKLKKGTGQPNLNREDLKNIIIKLPRNGNQQIIVEYCDNLTQMIDKMEQQISSNNVLMKQIIDNYLNQTQIVNEGQEIQEIQEDVVDTIQEPVDTKHDQEPIKKSPVIQIKPKINVSIVDVPTNGEDLNKLILPKLREIAKEKGLSGYSKLKKADLIELIKSK